jgi:hypothetical protein
VRGISTIKVIGNPRNLNLVSTEETKVTMYGSWSDIYAANEEKAHQLTSELLQTERSGDTLFITINKPVSENTFAQSTNGNVTLYIPSTIEVDTDVQHSSKQTLVLVDVSLNKQGTPQFVKMQVIPDVKGKTLVEFAHKNIEPGAPFLSAHITV